MYYGFIGELFSTLVISLSLNHLNISRKVETTRHRFRHSRYLLTSFCQKSNIPEKVNEDAQKVLPDIAPEDLPVEVLWEVWLSSLN